MNKKIGLAIIIILLLLLSFNSLAEENQEQDKGHSCLYYYYGVSCDGCEQVTDHLKLLQLQYPSLEVQNYEVYQNFKKVKELESFFKAYNIPEESRGVPAVFMEGNYFIGVKPIKEFLEGSLDGNTVCPTPIAKEMVGIVGEKEPYRVTDTLGYFSVLVSALRDSIRPGMLSIFIVFLIMLTAIQNKEEMLKKGLVSLGAIILAYLLSGLGLFLVLRSDGLTVFISKIIAFLAIFYGAASFKGFFQTWERIFGKISEEKSKEIKDGANLILTTTGFGVIGFVLALITQNKGSKVLNILQHLTATSDFRIQSLNLYLYHRLITLVPLILLIAAIFLGKEKLKERAKMKANDNKKKILKWEEHYHSLFNLVTSIIILALGLVLLFA